MSGYTVVRSPRLQFALTPFLRLLVTYTRFGYFTVTTFVARLRLPHARAPHARLLPVTHVYYGLLPAHTFTRYTCVTTAFAHTFVTFWLRFVTRCVWLHHAVVAGYTRWLPLRLRTQHLPLPLRGSSVTARYILRYRTAPVALRTALLVTTPGCSSFCAVDRLLHITHVGSTRLHTIPVPVPFGFVLQLLFVQFSSGLPRLCGLRVIHRTVTVATRLRCGYGWLRAVLRTVAVTGYVAHTLPATLYLVVLTVCSTTTTCRSRGLLVGSRLPVVTGLPTHHTQFCRLVVTLRLRLRLPSRGCRICTRTTYARVLLHCRLVGLPHGSYGYALHCSCRFYGYAVYTHLRLVAARLLFIYGSA